MQAKPLHGMIHFNSDYYQSRAACILIGLTHGIAAFVVRVVCFYFIQATTDNTGAHMARIQTPGHGALPL